MSRAQVLLKVGVSERAVGYTRKVRPVLVREMQRASPLVTQRRYRKAKAEKIAAEFDIALFGIPAVNHIDNVYRIIDGQHRVEGLKMWFGDSDPGQVDCDVFEGLTDAQAAHIFLGVNERTAVQRFDKFFISCTAEYPRETDILRTVESQRLKISQSKQANCVGAVSALTTVYDQVGAVGLGRTLRALRDGFPGDPVAFDSVLLQGMGLVVSRFNSQLEERDLVSSLVSLPRGVRALLQRAEAQRERTGAQKVQCVAAAIVDYYNKGRKAKRLPSWWKAMDEES